VITPPTGSGLEIDAYNAPVPTSGVSGVTAIVKYTPVGGGALTTLEQTTGSGGCVVFSGIPATAAIVEIREIPGYVTRSGAPKFPTKEVTIAPNYTTHYPVVYNKGGAITARFAYNGLETYSHPNNEGSGEVSGELVTGDTFVVSNNLMAAAPDYEIGSTRYNPATEVFNPIPSTFEAAATSPSNLFPFTESEKSSWGVYAGDCLENNPEKVTGGTVKPPEKIYFSPGETKAALVPTSLVTLNLYKGTEKEVNALGASKWKALETLTEWPVTITNLKCTGTTPNNEATAIVKHVQKTSIGSLFGGHLQHQFQPFAAEIEMCVYVSPNAFMRRYEDKETKGPVIPIYLGQKSTQEKATQKAKEEAEEKTVKTNRENAEKATKKQREKEEGEKRKLAEEAEVAQKKQWEKEKFSKAQIEAKEKAARKKREEEEGEKRTAAEEAETATRVAKEKEEKEVKTKREEREATEAAEAASSKVNVETRAGCP
jgi:hypothetical protein